MGATGDRSPSSGGAARRGRIRIGISGWRYDRWRGVFYPPGLPQRRELEFASRTFDTIELNGSFYSLQRPEYYAAWRDQTPDGFVFAVKGSRFITHMLKLRNVETPLANFFASGLVELGDKLGPLLWQFPPQLSFDEARFDRFFGLLPRDTDAAMELARAHDTRLEGRACLRAGRKRRLRHAVEIRHGSFANEAFVALLRRHRIALVVADTARRWPLLEDLTADFVYVRLHGDKELYASGYEDRALDDWASRIEAWSRGREVEGARVVSGHAPAKLATRDVYCYFDNDVKVHAPYDAARLASRLGVPTGLEDPDSFTPPEHLAFARPGPPDGRWRRR